MILESSVWQKMARFCFRYSLHIWNAGTPVRYSSRRIVSSVIDWTFSLRPPLSRCRRTTCPMSFRRHKDSATYRDWLSISADFLVRSSHYHITVFWEMTRHFWRRASSFCVESVVVSFSLPSLPKTCALPRRTFHRVGPDYANTFGGTVRCVNKSNRV